MPNIDRMYVTRRLAAGAMSILFAVLGASACGAPASTGESRVAAPSTESTSDSAAFRLVADVIGGGLLSLDDELATRPVALWFWAPG